MTEKDKTLENQSMEQYNLHLAGAIINEELSNELQACMNEDGATMPVEKKTAIQEKLDRLKQAEAVKGVHVQPKHRKPKMRVIVALIVIALISAGFTAFKLYELERIDREKQSQIIMPTLANENDLEYKISDLPDGFILDEIIMQAKVTETRYVDGNGTFLLFRQAPMQDHYFDNETEQEDVRLGNGNIAYLSDKDGILCIFWRDKDTYLSITAQLDKETMLSIADSIIQK